MRGRGGGGVCGVSANEYQLYEYTGAQTNFGDLTPYLIYDLEEMFYSFTMVKYTVYVFLVKTLCDLFINRVCENGVLKFI
jgi:hypothetical protein